jgi:AraC-like DNA-binding protein
MAALVNDMYVLGFMTLARNLRTRLFPSGGPLPLFGGIKTAGTVHDNVGISFTRQRDLGTHALVYLVNGGGEYGDERGTRKRVSAGDLIWLFPGVRHYYGPPAKGRWDEIYLLVEGPFVDLWRTQKIITPERPVWRLEPVDFWFGRLEAAALGAASTGWEASFLQLSRFQGLVAEMVLASRGAEESSPGWLALACRLLEADEHPAPALEEIARQTGMSYESFRKKFAQRMGTAPAQYRQARLIEKACGLLMQRDRPHKEIAEKLGFCDEFHFSKVFHRQMGFSPRTFRLQVLGSGRKADPRRQSSPD